MDVLIAVGSRHEATAEIAERVFPRRLDRERLDPAERLIASAIGAPTGDFRRWDEIDRWAHSIGDELERRGRRDRSTAPRGRSTAVTR
jgi:hypothetical protein